MFVVPFCQNWNGINADVFLWESSQYFQIFSNHRFLCRLLTWRSSAKSPCGFLTVGVVVAHTDSWCIELNEKQEGFVYAFIKRLQFTIIKKFLHMSWCVGCYACYKSLTRPLLIMFLCSHFNQVKLYLVLNLSFTRWRSEDQQVVDTVSIGDIKYPLSDTTGRRQQVLNVIRKLPPKRWKKGRFE